MRYFLCLYDIIFIYTCVFTPDMVSISMSCQVGDMFWFDAYFIKLRTGSHNCPPKRPLGGLVF